MTRYITLLTVVAAMALWAGPAHAQTTTLPTSTEPATQAAPAVDHLKGLLDDYVQGEERTRFFASAGVDGELSKEEWDATAGKANSFVRSYDRWEAAIAHDQSNDGKLNWAEAEAYRLGIRKRLLELFDENKDGRLTGSERGAANAHLAGGLSAPVRGQRGAGPGGRGDQPRRQMPQRSARSRGGRVDQEQTAAREAEGARLRQQLAEQRRRYQESIANYDKDGDGRLNAEESRAMSEAYRAERQQRLLEQWDANKDGKLDDQENQAMREAQRRQAEDRRRQWLVQRHDRDGDGQLSQQEQAAMAAEQQRWDQLARQWEQRRRQSIRRWDADGDGGLSETERQAMQRGIRAEMEQRRGQMDADGNGNVSPEEMRSYWNKLREKYDADRDGQLNEQERQKMMNEEGWSSLLGMQDAGRGRRGGAGGRRGGAGGRRGGPGGQGQN
ncbi:MAG: hypothetical protein AMJ81_04790 [Phycisphaerae bacterium SM23_33]|nr:MAG: hypothetical protein AMJ81_04790 [Phycisphaerae bacterium SM23_33]